MHYNKSKCERNGLDFPRIYGPSDRKEGSVCRKVRMERSLSRQRRRKDLTEGFPDSLRCEDRESRSEGKIFSGNHRKIEGASGKALCPEYLRSHHRPAGDGCGRQGRYGESCLCEPQSGRREGRLLQTATSEEKDHDYMWRINKACRSAEISAFLTVRSMKTSS